MIIDINIKLDTSVINLNFNNLLENKFFFNGIKSHYLKNCLLDLLF